MIALASLILTEKGTICDGILVILNACLEEITHFKAVLYEKLKGAQCSKLVKFRVPSI